MLTQKEIARYLSLAQSGAADVGHRLARIMLGRRIVNVLAKQLGLQAAYDVEYLPNGAVALHSEGLYLVLPTFGNNLYFRRVANRRDYTGGINYWLPMSTLSDIKETATIIHGVVA